jgi:hypothetical protein
MWAILSQASNEEGATTIPKGSRNQAVPKRRATHAVDDMVWPRWQQREIWRKRSYRNNSGRIDVLYGYKTTRPELAVRGGFN